MRSGGHTTVIQRVLERRAEKPPTGEEGTTATVAVMLRVLPPPKALLVLAEPHVRQEMERRITPDMLDLDSVEHEDEALRRFAVEFRPLVLTDSLELIRKLRSRPAGSRAPFIVYLAELDETSEREAGLASDGARQSASLARESPPPGGLRSSRACCGSPWTRTASSRPRMT
jgi:hypothetical protein